MKQITKPIQINSNLHAELKEFCGSRGLKLQKLVEILIADKLKKDGNSIPTS
jgi:hypothetical protein